MGDLYKAIIDGDLISVQECLANGEEPNSVPPDRSECLLTIAAQRGKTKIVNAMLDAGADPNWRLCGEWPIIYATAFGYKKMVRSLIDAGAQVDVTSEDCTTPLMLAAAGGYKSIIKQLLKYGADPRRQDRDGESAITIAAIKSHWDIVDLLAPFATESDLKAVECIKNPPSADSLPQEVAEFFEAVKRGDEKQVQTYLESGSDVNVLDENEWPAVRWSSMNSNLPLTKKLIQAGADLSLCDEEGNTLLYTVARIGGDEILYQYLRQHTPESFRAEADQKRDELIRSEQWRWSRPDIEKRFEQQNLRKKEVSDLFSLARSSLMPDVEPKLFEKLKENLELAHVIDSEGSTMLMMAVRSRNIRLVKYLVEVCNVDVNQTNVYGHCALRDARPQLGMSNPNQREKIYDYLYPLTEEPLRNKVEITIAREAKEGEQDRFPNPFLPKP